jgi:hypothetical protein
MPAAMAPAEPGSGPAGGQNLAEDLMMDFPVMYCEKLF